MQVPERKNYHRFFCSQFVCCAYLNLCVSTVPLQVQILVVVVVAVVVAVSGAVFILLGTFCHPLVVSVVFALLVVFCLVLVISVLVLVVLAVSDVSVGSVRNIGKFCFSLSASVGVCARRGHRGSDSGSDSGSNTVGYYCIVG